MMGTNEFGEHEGYDDDGSGGGVTDMLKTATIRVTAAQLSALNSVPILALAAPGAGKAIVPVAAATFGSLGGAPMQFLPGDSWSHFGDLPVSVNYGNPPGSNAPWIGSPIQGLLGTDLLTTTALQPVTVADVSAIFNNQPLYFTSQGGTGRITASTLNTGGLGYAPGDTFTVDGDAGDATGIVNTVGALGVVTDYSVTDGGHSYPIGGGVTTTATTGIGTGLTINITAIQSVANGNGDLILTLAYIVIDLG